MEIAEFERLTGMDWEHTHHQCHAAALKLVRSGRFENARVARGTCRGVPSQHSWVVLGGDCYDDMAHVIDPVLWSYDEDVEGVWVGSTSLRPHRPHGSEGTIWSYGRPSDPEGPVIELATDLSDDAKLFLEMAAPKGLDLRGWHMLAHAPVKGWPSEEIIGAMWDTPRLRTVPPIDIVGMLTDRNPSSLYR